MKRKPSARHHAPSSKPAAANGHEPRSRAPRSVAPARQRVNLTPYADAPNLVSAAAGFERLTLFSSALRIAGLEPLLSEQGPFTIFAPTNRAFEKLPPQEFDALLADPDRLARVLCHHVVPGRVRAPRPDSPRLAMPIAGAELHLSATDERYHVEEASIVRTNIRASNGVIHAIDTVLFAT